MRKVSAKAKYSEAKPTHLPVFQWVKSNNLIQKKMNKRSHHRLIDIDKNRIIIDQNQIF